jgi:hypothetical protein
MSMVSLLAACGSSGGQQSSSRPTASFAAEAAAHPQPASYEPPGPPSDPWGPYIKEASKRFDVPERWIREVMRQESGGRVTARSPVGAMGLMQVMPGTYAELRGRYGLGEDAYHPWNSIMSGTAYVREMYELYGSPGFLAAYNGGPRRLEDYLWNGRGLPAETRNYVARIGPRIDGTHPNRRAAPEVYAAAELPLNIPAGPRRGDTATMLALREQRNAVDPGVRMASLPAGPVVRMEPIPDGSTYTQVASLDTGIGGGPVTRMDPIPDGSTYGTAAPAPAPVASPAPAAATYTPIYTPSAAASATAAYVPPASAAPPSVTSTASAASLPTPAPSPAAPPPVLAVVPPAPPPAPPPMAPAPSLLAEAPRPHTAERPSAASVIARYTPEPSRAEAPRPQFVMAEIPRPAETGPKSGFSLIGSAHAATVPFKQMQMRMPNPAIAPAPVAAAVPAPGQWGVQVGAFASANLARAAADEARGRLGVGGAKTAVESVESGRSTLYRARVLGLSRDNAQAACDKLRSRGACIIVSPGAQS